MEYGCLVLGTRGRRQRSQGWGPWILEQPLSTPCFPTQDFRLQFLLNISLNIFFFFWKTIVLFLLLFHIIFSIYSYSTIIHPKFWEFNYHECDWGSHHCEGDLYICLPGTKIQRSRCFKSPGLCALWAGLFIHKTRDLNRDAKSTWSPQNPGFPNQPLRTSKRNPEVIPRSQTQKCLPPFGRSLWSKNVRM